MKKMQFLFTHAYKHGLMNHKIHSANPNWSQYWSWIYHITLNFVSSQIGRLIPAQPNFYTLHKSEHCSPRHELFSDFLVSYESWDHNLSIHINFFPQNRIFYYSAAISKVYSFFWDTWYKANFVRCYRIYKIWPFEGL